MLKYASLLAREAGIPAGYAGIPVHTVNQHIPHPLPQTHPGPTVVPGLQIAHCKISLYLYLCKTAHPVYSRLVLVISELYINKMTMSESLKKYHNSFVPLLMSLGLQSVTKVICSLKMCALMSYMQINKLRVGVRVGDGGGASRDLRFLMCV